MKIQTILRTLFLLTSLAAVLPGCRQSHEEGGRTQATQGSPPNPGSRQPAPSSPNKTAKISGAVLRNADGSIRFMNQLMAMKACPAGTHLPTTRELAEESQARGAKGILELSQVPDFRPPPGYEKISAINPDATKDEFYFSPEGYKRPSGESEQYWLWSSSVEDSGGGMVFGYDRYEISGDLGKGPRGSDVLKAVRCADGPTTEQPTDDGIIRNNDGTVADIAHVTAFTACPQGTHLPTIRELSEESQAKGAKGILELSQVNADQIPKGYQKISAINPDGRKDEFYFNPEGQKRPLGDLGHYWFWSSSRASEYQGYEMHGSGGITTYYSNYASPGVAVRCLAGPPR